MDKTHILETECLRIEIADAGAELSRVLDKESGMERLWWADPAVWNRHAPLLFPFVGKVIGGRYRTDSGEYPMKTQHGFARDLDFDCAEETADAVAHSLCSSDRTREIYPYDFRLTVRHSVDAAHPRVLRIAWTVENTGSGRMYYSIGGHPGFLPPRDVKKEDCLFVFPGHDELWYFGADSEGFALPEQKKKLTLKNGAAPYQPDIPATWIFENQGIDTVQIAAPDGRPYVTMDCAGFPQLAVWANAKGPYVCLEPWYGRTDDAGFAGTLAQKPGVQILDSGETQEISYKIEFHSECD